jgi:hypothetical protein
MCSNDAAIESSRPRRLNVVVAGLGGLLAAALFSGALDGGFPKPARAEVAAPAPAASAGLCFHGPGGELLTHCR